MKNKLTQLAMLLLLSLFCLNNSSLNAQCDPNAPSILYAPSWNDDAGWRAEIAAATGGTVDYFDGAAATPSLVQLQNYCAVITWANFSYLDNVAMGDVLADYVDAGGQVILGVFSTYTSGAFLSGRIMTDGYSPVTSPTGSNTFSTSSYAGDGSPELYAGVTTLTSGFQDVLQMQGSGILDGTFMNGEVQSAYQPNYSVFYLNGLGDRAGIAIVGEWDQLVANAVFLFQQSLVPIPTLGQWGIILLFLSFAIIGIAVLRQKKDILQSV